MNACNNCVHWQHIKESSNPNWNLRNLNLGKCSKPSPLWDAVIYDYESDTNEMSPEYADHKMFVQDASNFMADLYTTPDFSCVCHVLKDPT